MWRTNSINNGSGTVSIFNTASAAASEERLNSYTFHEIQQDNAQDIRRALLMRLSREDETRVVIVQDLSPTIIEVIYTTFMPSPEFFEQHLERALYGDSRLPRWTEGSLGSTIWATSLLARSHCSLRWWRPLLRQHRNDLNDIQWAKLLEYGFTDRLNAETIYEDVVSKTSNITRAEFEVMAQFSDATDITENTNDHDSADTIDDSDEKEQTGSMSTAVTAWEERVTIHHNVRDGVTSSTYLVLQCFSSC